MRKTNQRSNLNSFERQGHWQQPLRGSGRATEKMELRLGATVQLTDLTTRRQGRRQSKTAGRRRARHRHSDFGRSDGRAYDAWGSFTCDRSKITKHSAGPPGTCVLFSGNRTGTLLGWRDGAHLVREGAADVEVATESIQKTVPAAQNLRVRTLFGDGVATSVDVSSSTVALDWGATLKAPHATSTVRCPAAAAVPVVRCVAQSTQTMVARSLDTLKQLTTKVSADTRQRLSDQLGDVDGALDSIETQLTDASSIKALASSTMTDDLQQRASTALWEATLLS